MTTRLEKLMEAQLVLDNPQATEAQKHEAQTAIDVVRSELKRLADERRRRGIVPRTHKEVWHE